MCVLSRSMPRTGTARWNRHICRNEIPEIRSLILRSRGAASRRVGRWAFYAPGASFETPFLTKWLLRMRTSGNSELDTPHDVEEPAHIHRNYAWMAEHIRTTHAVRLGFRQVKGLSESDMRKLVSLREKGYDSVRDVWLRTGLEPAALERLAEADAFAGLGLSRRDAIWAVRGLNRAGDKDDLPLLAPLAFKAIEPDANLPLAPAGRRGDRGLSPSVALAQGASRLVPASGADAERHCAQRRSCGRQRGAFATHPLARNSVGPRSSCGSGRGPRRASSS